MDRSKGVIRAQKHHTSTIAILYTLLQRNFIFMNELSQARDPAQQPPNLFESSGLFVRLIEPRHQRHHMLSGNAGTLLHIVIVKAQNVRVAALLNTTS
jgi:hypothetical protein